MRFQKLTIHNIASIEDAVIDFESQPLADSEVFLITGKTGAGKSTILDAICLALYAKTPRMVNTKMEGDTNDGEKTMVAVNDPRQLMRRNTGEASASLTFTGSNCVHYQATWSVARARKKVTGNLQSKQWQLENLDKGHVITKGNEIKAEIKAAIGLDFNQFCRTTMLAQGEFTRFLNSKDDEKAEILEKITGVDVYSKIGAKVYAVTGKKEQIWRDAQRLVEGTHTLTETEIADKQAAITALDTQFNQIKSSSDKEIIKRDWMKADEEFTKGIADATDALKKANEVLESNDFKQKEQLIKEWNATINARRCMTEVEKAENAQKSQKTILAGLADSFASLLGAQKFAEQEAERIALDIKDTDTFLSDESGKADVYDKSQTIIGYLNTIHEGRRTIEKSQGVIANENKILTGNMIPALEKAKGTAQEAKEAFDKEETQIKIQEETVSALNLAELRTKRDTAKDMLGRIATAKERIETLTTTSAQKEKSRKCLDERLATIGQKKKKSADMDATIHDAKLIMDTHKKVLDKQSDTIDKFAKTLRSKLQVGDTCPVCRQKIERGIPHEEELSAFVSKLKESYEKAERDYKSLADTQLKIDAEIKTEAKAYEQDMKASEEDKSVVNAEQKAMEACKVCGIEEINNTTLSSLDALTVKTNDTKEKIDREIKDGESRESDVKRLRKQLDGKRKDIESLSETVRSAEKEVNDCMGRISTADALVRSKQEEVSIAESNTRGLIIAGHWNINWNESPQEFALCLTMAAKKYADNVKRRQTLDSRYQTTKNNIESSSSIIASILTAMPTWKEIQPTNIAKADNILGMANDISTSVTTALTQLKSAEENLSANQSNLSLFLAGHNGITIGRLVSLNTYTSSDILSKDALLKKDRDTVVAKQTLLDNASRLHHGHQQHKPDFAASDTLDILASHIADFEKELGEIGEQKGAINQELKTDKENKDRLGTLMEDARNKEADYQKWSHMNQFIGDATGNKFRKIAQSYVLSSLIHSANSYMRTLTDRYTLKVTPGTFVISLEDAYQGFVSRAASTISGGESFLISLSLALALSDIGQTLSVDTLFIDEGFGTLSGEPLQNAISTLRSLHTKAGRHVGIISHVEELQERIPVQIQVNQEGNNSSSKIKIVPETV